MESPSQKPKSTLRRREWMYDLLFVAVLFLGAVFRFAGLNWDEGTYLHPDERFLAMVESSIEPVGSFSEYWDTGVSSLNPNNRDHGFFVYGTLPIFFVRYAMEWVGQAGYGEVAKIGRPLAGLFDLLTVFLLYLTASRLYDRRVGVLAAAFSAFAVLQIQLSHFFTVDIFANFFIWLAIYLGARILTAKPPGFTDLDVFNQGGRAEQLRSLLANLWRLPIAVPILAFGLATGAAAASKVSAFPVAFLLPVAAWIAVSRHPLRERHLAVALSLVLLTLSGLLAVLSFRVFQPYAFTGPGFLGFQPNELWLEAIGRLQDLVQPSSGFPPSVQWFDRPIWFSGKNMIVWGLGLPLGLAAWAGFLWMGFRIFRSEWKPHLLVWLWVGGHFLWQSTVPNPTMRYQLPVYPGMALMAAWSLVTLRDRLAAGRTGWRSAGRAFAVFLGAAVLGATLLYAAAFTRIYQKDVTRIAASRWMYQNVPGALNLPIRAGSFVFNQPLPFPNGFEIRAEAPFTTSFIANESGTLAEVASPHLLTRGEGGPPPALFLMLTQGPDDGLQMATSLIDIDPEFDPARGGAAYFFEFNEPVPLQALQTYNLTIELIGDTGSLEICEPLSLTLISGEGSRFVTVPAPEDCQFSSGQPFRTVFTPEVSGDLPGVALSRPFNYKSNPPPQVVSLQVLDPSGGVILGWSELEIQGDTDDLVFSLDSPVSLVKGRTYQIRVAVETGPPISLEGSRLAQETSWDDPLPMRVDGYDGFGGIYKGDNNLELYWEDNPEKVERIIRILRDVDVIQISSSRQWGSLTRLSDRWPLVDRYYRELLGCPPERSVEWCYNTAEPGMFTSRLGFELVEVFVSNPSLGFLALNDQPSEEAFTVYDHPKVFIFRKTAAFDSERVRALFESIELPAAGLSQDQPQEPVKSLLLSEQRLEQQQAGAAWFDLFDSNALINRFQPLTALVWYLAVAVLGIAVYPLLRWALPGLEDKGYPLARTAGLLLLSYFVWLLGSFGLAVTKGLISTVIALLLAAGAWAAYRQRGQLRSEWRAKREYFWMLEAFALALFLFVLFIRIGNPDLWHPWKGGEKPMDFAYFNAVLRSVAFPPYDPWFSGGYINYYYYGFVFAGVLVKWLGIIPSVAYNLIVPTLFMLLGLGAFSIGWNLVLPGLHHSGLEAPAVKGHAGDSTRWAYFSGLAASLGIALLGNFGTIRMIFQGYQRVAAPPGAVLEETFLLTRWVWTLRGFVQVLSTQAELPYGLADWYWNPSRAIPAPGDIEPITEFPFFTFLYGDLHAHMIVMPLTLLALAWALSVILGRGRWSGIAAGVFSFFLGGLAIGVLRPTNTWDYPTYLVVGVLAVSYTAWCYARPALQERFSGLPGWAAGGLPVISGASILAGLSWFLFQPYTESYALGFSEIRIWQGIQTPLSAYLTHWGLFLFVILTWMLWETREWLAAIPAFTAIRYLRRKGGPILIGFALLAVLTVARLYLGAGSSGAVREKISSSLLVQVVLGYLSAELSVYVLPLAAWAGVLLLRPGLPLRKRVVLFLTGTGLFLTLMVETIAISGDIGRMNTVFKFYLQVWVLFGIAAAASLSWLLADHERWKPAWSRSWRLVVVLLIAGAALYPLLGGFAKITDRMAEDAPITLDGMAYMPYAAYYDQGRELRLAEDYRAIRWFQETVRGTPTIVEAQIVEYRWGSRYSIYTGLPAVLGWNWHQRQQRTGHDLDVWDRSNRIQDFYNTTNINVANRFLDEFDVNYIIVGQLERAYYDDAGLEKFETFNGRYWREVYRDGETLIYEVIH